MSKLYRYGVLLGCVVSLFFGVGVSVASTVRLMKTVDDPKVFLVDNNRRIHIPNPSIFEAGGYKWSDIRDVSRTQMERIPNTALIKSPVDAKVYVIREGKKQHIPNETAFSDAGYKGEDIVLISQAQVDFFEEEIYAPAISPVSSEIQESPSAPVSEIYTRPQRTEIIDLGRLLPDERSIVDFNNNGEVVMRDYGNTDGTGRYIWKSGVKTRASNDIALLSDAGSKIMYDSQALGVVMYVDNGSSKSRVKGLGGFALYATDLNDHDEVVGTSDIRGGGIDGGVSHAFLWKNGVTLDLGTFGGSESNGNAINDNGTVVGWAQSSDKKGYAFAWENGTMRRLSTLGGSFSEARDISDSGMIVGTSHGTETQCDGGCTHAVLWDGDKIIDVGTEFRLEKINAHNEVIGFEYDSLLIDEIRALYPYEQWTEILERNEIGAGHGVVWKNNTLFRLSDIIDDEDIILTDATHINDRGEIIAKGFDTEDLYMHNYLIRLPENIPPTFRFVSDGVFNHINPSDVEEEWELKENPPKRMIQWHDADPDDDAVIKLYYHTSDSIQGQATQGTLIANNISENATKNTYIWDMTSYPFQAFYVYAVIDDGKTQQTVESDALKRYRANYERAKALEEADGVADETEIEETIIPKK